MEGSLHHLCQGCKTSSFRHVPGEVAEDVAKTRVFPFGDFTNKRACSEAFVSFWLSLFVKPAVEIFTFHRDDRTPELLTHRVQIANEIVYRNVLFFQCAS